MQGLLKNHYYKIVSNLKILLIFIVLVGVLILIFGDGDETLLVNFVYLTVIGLPFISSISLRKNGSGKWNKYILSLPIKRCEIIKSVFMTQLITVVIGSILSMGLFAASFTLYGFSFYRYVDVLLLFSAAVGIILIMNSIFLPISYLDSNDRTEAISIISLLVSVAIMIGLITVTNILLGKPSNTQLVIFSIVTMVLSGVAFVLSCFFTIRIYSKQDC